MPTTPDRLDLPAVVEASGLLDPTGDLDRVLSNLLLVAMSRLLVTRGVVLLASDDGGSPEVAVVKGPMRLGRGEAVPVALKEMDGEAVPDALRAHGIALALPLRDASGVVGLVGLGPKATGAPFGTAETTYVRSLVNLSAVAVRQARVAAQLDAQGRALAARVQELNTLFDLARAFSAAHDRDRAVRLLALALLGQMTPSRHLVLLRDHDAAPPLVADALGFPKPLSPDALDLLAGLDTPLLRNGQPGNPNAALLEQHGLDLAVPVRLRESTCGLIALGPRATGRPYTREDLAFLTSLGTLALSAIENANLVAARIEKERLEEEMRLARTIQERLLPEHTPHLAGLDVAAMARSSRHVAGDYYDLAALDADRLLVAVADVAGKGMPAALLMANLQACLHLLRQRLDDTAGLAPTTAQLNRVVCANTDPFTFITFFWGVLDRRTGRFTYVNAGHNPPLLARAGGPVEMLMEGGVLLGVLPEAVYAQGEVTMDAGDRLLLYTDGVTEARSPDDEEYAEGRLERVLLAHADASAEALIAAVAADVAAFTADAPLADDFTLVAVRRER
ncbi:MAG TPA: GAF domain-containing SpoIIE family protein phosphatase [Rubricoccaceae bacterium]|nr:GAF domain-containing SpoIIE family protein phosphatase [Rubricoccaceae bacterium]